MYRVVGLNEKDIVSTESFTDAFEIFYEKCIDPIAQGKKPQNPETTCYIEAVGGENQRTHELPVCIRVRGQGRAHKGRKAGRPPD